jgi:hypothetical protein
LDLWLKDYDAFCAKTPDKRKVEKIRDVIRKTYIRSYRIYYEKERKWQNLRGLEEIVEKF